MIIFNQMTFDLDIWYATRSSSYFIGHQLLVHATQ